MVRSRGRAPERQGDGGLSDSGTIVPRGSCLCGAVAWEVEGAFAAMSHCHCSMCRKNHGAAFATYAEAPAREFRFTAGEERVRRYRSSPPVERSFCGECGSNLLFVYQPTPDRVWVAAGTCDDDPGVRPTRHIFVASKAAWFEITDDLAQEPAGGT